MPPRTPLGIINGNRGYGHELTPNQRGKIEGAKLSGSTNKVAAEIGKCARLSREGTSAVGLVTVFNYRNKGTVSLAPTITLRLTVVMRSTCSLPLCLPIL